MRRYRFAILLTVLLLFGCDMSEEEYLQAHEAGLSEGVNIDQDECLKNSIEKIKACSSLSCSVSTDGYFRACFSVATKSSTICNEVPPDEGQFKHGSWRAKQCDMRGADPAHCDVLFSTLQAMCQSS